MLNNNAICVLSTFKYQYVKVNLFTSDRPTNQPMSEKSQLSKVLSQAKNVSIFHPSHLSLANLPNLFGT